MKKMLSMLLLALMSLVMLGPVALADQDAIRNSCVRVYAEDDLSAWVGTAFAVGKPNSRARYYVTNRHVVDGAVNVNIIFDNSNNMVPCNVLAVSDRCDLAVIVLDSDTNVGRSPAVLRMFDAETELGHKTEDVWAYGYPAFAIDFNAGGTGDKLRADTRRLIVTDGTISGIGDHANTKSGETIMHTANISGGNSGGPLVDRNGYVLGVNAYKRFASIEDNIAESSYAVSVNELIRLLDSEGIPYTTVGDQKNRQILIISLIAAGVVIVAVVAILLMRKKGVSGSRNTRNSSNRRILTCESGALAGHAPFELKARTTIGREKAHPDIAFPDNTPGVSGQHCTVTIENGQVKVCDNNSSYGTWIDNVKLQPGVPMVMHRGQRLYLGSKREVFILRS